MRKAVLLRRDKSTKRAGHKPPQVLSVPKTSPRAAVETGLTFHNQDLVICASSIFNKC